MAKLIPMEGNFRGESHLADSLQIQYLAFYEQKLTTLHSCRKQFSSFKDFKAFFVLLTWDILELDSESDAIGDNFKRESHQVE